MTNAVGRDTPASQAASLPQGVGTSNRVADIRASKQLLVPDEPDFFSSSYQSSGICWIWSGLIALISRVFCCIFSRGERLHRRAHEGQDVGRVRLRLQPAQNIVARENSNPRFQVQRFLAEFPESGRPRCEEFYRQFRVLPAAVKLLAKQAVDKEHEKEIDQLMCGEIDDRKGLETRSMPRFDSRDQAIEDFIRKNVFNRVVREALGNFCRRRA
ncbi:MAG: hypothetical protein ACHQT8_02490 [Chlamydiales bacterium]